jgi:hypothetical protein
MSAPRKLAKSPAFEARRIHLAMRVAMGMTLAEACTEVGVNRKTGGKWLAEPETAELVADFKRSTVDQARSAINAAAVRAVACLMRAAEKGDTRAAEALLDRAGVLRLTPEQPAPPPTTAVLVQIGENRETAINELRSLTEQARAERALKTGASS